jgi:hypothetical protein
LVGWEYSKVNRTMKQLKVPMKEWCLNRHPQVLPIRAKAGSLYTEYKQLFRAMPGCWHRDTQWSPLVPRHSHLSQSDRELLSWKSVREIFFFPSAHFYKTQRWTGPL